MNRRGASGDLDLLLRRGGDPRVAVKKVLLSVLAEQACRQRGVRPEPALIGELADTFRAELELLDPAGFDRWLHHAGVSRDQFDGWIHAMAAVLTVETQLEPQLRDPLSTHRRLMAAREQRLRDRRLRR